MFVSETYGRLELRQIPDKIEDYYRKMEKYGSVFRIIVGTDSQNFSDTKMVTVIAAYCEGHGGIFFYEVSRIRKIRDVRKKLHVETEESLKVAEKLITGLEEYEKLYMDMTFSIHVDAGTNPHGRTKELIPELVGWIRSCGYACETKPDSWVASSVADRISK
jgi:predicted RNase H-related nuclease YkuK (DUF458 family)